MPAGPPPRRHDIDWLRIGATFLLFPFHAARPFDHQPWHVKSPDAASGFDLFVWFIHQFQALLTRTIQRRPPWTSPVDPGTTARAPHGYVHPARTR